MTVRDSKIAILSDKNSVVFSGSITGSNKAEIYTMNIDGCNLLKIFSGDASSDFYAPEAYW